MEQPEKGLFAYVCVCCVCACVLCQFLGHTTLLALELSGMENFGCEITNKVFFSPNFVVSNVLQLL
jgi:hypothetical protein